MLGSNKGAADLTRNLKRNERTGHLKRSPAKKNRICDGGEPTELLISGDLLRNSNQGVPSEINKQIASNLSKSVVSVALFNGETLLLALSGIPVQRLGNVTRFLTSASLAKAFNDGRKVYPDLKVVVRHENKVVPGFLDKHDPHLNIAAVNVMDLSDLHTVLLSRDLKFPPHKKVVAVGCDVSGNLISTQGILNEGSCGSRYMSSTCKISEVYEGGPLFDFDGNLVGINLSLDKETTLYLPMIVALIWLDRCGSLENTKFPVRDGLSMYQVEDLESLGYPKPKYYGMILVNTFEEPFGNKCGEGVWRKLSETTSDILKRNVVALASFRGKERFFACTGLFIEWNGRAIILTSASLLRESGYKDQKIVTNLRIEVLLPNKNCTEGKLEYVNLHYNVALVSVKDFSACQPVKVEERWPGSGEVLALGRYFSSGILMAAKGQRYSRPGGSFDCKYLGYSTCKITKAGIGGPLLDYDGKFVGMNFYDKYVGHTPYLSWCEILPLLEYFKTKGAVAEGDYCGNPSDKPDWAKEGDNSVFCNSWHVPSPCWYDPEVLEKVENEAQSRVPRYLIELEWDSDSDSDSE
ncbi:uncharacterized protein [Lolium perenne]|uniref:uncharacterized protein n=1 Tax=Lolium perenne TaxID=4522 RepID=UPI0021F56440|nr:uncharacterized protein LOC127298682 [Lolium perenne]